MSTKKDKITPEMAEELFDPKKHKSKSKGKVSKSITKEQRIKLFNQIVVDADGRWLDSSWFINHALDLAEKFNLDRKDAIQIGMDVFDSHDAWRYKKPHDPAPRGQRQSIISPAQMRAIWAESDRRHARSSWRKTMARGTKGGAVAKGRTFDPPQGWFRAMQAGIEKRSDVRNAPAIVKRIWDKLSPSKQAQIKVRELKGETFHYDLPLPVDVPTKGTGTVRTVKPFNLGEVQVNVSSKDYIELLKSKLFSKMRRNDGTTALVKRCKSTQGNVNMFVDRIR